MIMERPSIGHHYASPVVISHGGGASSRPSLGFPLGTALLIVVIFSLSGIFSCLYHWDKLRRTLNLDRRPDDDLEQPAKSPPPTAPMKKENERLSVIIMPGDDVPKFIATPCPPYPLPTHGGVLVEMQRSPPLKPPRLAVPLYI